jgi:hypothetical protein
MGWLWGKTDGEEEGSYTMQPFYWAMGSNSHTAFNGDGGISSIIEQNGSLWLYGSDEDYKSCYWNTAGSKTILGNEYKTYIVVSSGGNVYIAYDDGVGNSGYRVPGTGGQFTQLYGSGTTPANVQVTGIAVQ